MTKRQLIGSRDMHLEGQSSRLTQEIKEKRLERNKRTRDFNVNVNSLMKEILNFAGHS